MSLQKLKNVKNKAYSERVSLIKANIWLFSTITEGKGNLVSQTERLKELGAKAKKTINQKLLDRAESGGE